MGVIVVPKLKEECGIFGVWNNKNAAELSYLGLYALQHRGQESAGIVSCSKNARKFYVKKGMGLVSEVFDQKDFEKLKGSTAIGHVRYSTTGGSSWDNIQPLVVKYRNLSIAVAHNGNIPSARRWRNLMENEGVIFSTGTDSELILKMLVREEGTWEERLKKVLDKLKGSFSLLIMFGDKLIAVRDSFGLRPLVMGTRGDAVFFSSESCAFDIMEVKYKREIEPGEMIVIDTIATSCHNLKSHIVSPCIFELIYFSRPDSYVFLQSVYQARLNMARELAKETLSKLKADIVIPVPDSANVQALGYSKESGIPMEYGFIRNHYIGRTFIDPHQKIRDFRVKIKYTPIKKVISGKSVIMIDDSIVRGTTSKKLVNLLRRAGAKKIHLLISSPPIRYSCFYGINTPTRKELIAEKLKINKIKDYLGVDSLYYLSLDGLLRACKKMNYCLACFTGDYPLKKRRLLNE